MLPAWLKLVFKLLGTILSFFWPWKRRTESEVEARKREDIELADAIRRGDSETVSRILAKRQHYKNLCVLLVAVGATAMLAGCRYLQPSYHDIPLTDSEVVYKLPPGVYKDVQGRAHSEPNGRWAVAEGNLFRAIRGEAEPEPLMSRVQPWILVAAGVLVVYLAVSTMVRHSVARSVRDAMAGIPRGGGRDVGQAG